MSTQLPDTDHKPPAGSKRQVSRHFSILSTWAKGRQLATIAHWVGSLLIDEGPEEFLGGILRFIGYRETGQVLRAWAPGHPLIRKLARLSDCLSMDFPAIATPNASRRVDQLFPNQMEPNYLGAQFAARRPHNVSVDQVLGITCLRAWLLIKALEFAQNGCRYDLGLRQVSVQMRMALDDKGDPRKLEWFLALAAPSLDFQEFQTALRLHCDRKNAKDTAVMVDTLRAMKSVLDDDMKPGTPSKGFDPPPHLWDDQFPPGDDDAMEEVVDLESLADSTLFIPDPESGGGMTVQEVAISEQDTPPEIARESRAIAFQSLEDQQYLRCSWNRLHPTEETTLRAAIESAVLEGTPSQRLLAALTIVAMVCRQSMRTVESIALGTTTDGDWHLDPVAAVLHCLPARRRGHWRADDTAAGWIRPLCVSWRLALQPPIQAILQEAFRQRPHARVVGELWTDSAASLKQTFNQWCAKVPGLQRVSSGALVHAAEQQAFEQSDDAMFARLLTSTERSGIPGAGAYASWPVTQVAGAWTRIAKPFVDCSMHMDSPTNGMGSELDPDDAMLRAAMDRAYSKVVALAAQPSAWVEYHNHLVAYAVVVLLVATGGRPVESPFESSAHFDLLRRRLYIEDKVSPMAKAGRSGRIIPLPRAVTDFLADVYFPHLKNLANRLRSKLPELAIELDKQAAGCGSARFPLFAFLRNRPEFDWHVVNETALEQLDLFGWPLPWNLFRHRLAVRLRQLRLDTELIDAQLGHAEAGSETYGDYSPRCWMDDFEVWQSAVTVAYQQLDIQYPALVDQEVGDLWIAPGYSVVPEESSFGSRARAAQRERQRIAAKQRAQEEIQAFVGGRPIDSIASSDWEWLGRSMLLRPNNLPQANATIRYDAYEEFLHAVWRNTGARPRIRSWLARVPAARSAFSAQAIHASDQLHPVRTALDELFQGLQLSRTSRANCALLGALDLCLNGRVSEKPVLMALCQAQTSSIRLVKRDGRLHVEFSESLADSERAPVSRYLAPSRIAPYLDRALGAARTLDNDGDLPPLWSGLVCAAGWDCNTLTTADKLLGRLADLMDQANSLELPGLIAGVLSGRVTSFALDWHDWLRVHTGEARIDPRSSPATEHDRSVQDVQHEVPALRQPIGVTRSKEPEASKTSSKQLISNVRAALTNYLKPTHDEAGQAEPSSPKLRRKIGSNTENKSRRDTRTAIEALLHRCGPDVSVAAHALAAWVLHLLTRPYKKGLLDGASIKRYLDALSHGFTSFGHKFDLPDLDPDELTEFYLRVVDPSLLQANDDEDDRAASLNDAPTRKRDQQYVLQRLSEFHRFAAQRYGLETPDWSEIGEGLTAAVARPGFITLTEYEHARLSLCASPSFAPPSAVRDAFILLLAYRFGLRGGEAAAMARDEWVAVTGTVVVSVSGQHRKLKTRGSKRQVPLIGQLSEHEQLVTDRWLRLWQAETAGNPAIPLFFADPFQGGLIDMRAPRERIIAALRASTRTDHINLHHARHSFANRIGMALQSSSSDPIWQLTPGSQADTAQAVKLLLLNTEKNTRRSPWAIARLLGHASPRTTVQSYLHFLHDWGASLVVKGDPDRFGTVPHADAARITNLDLWSRDVAYLNAVPSAAPVVAARPTPSLIMRYFRFRAQGMVAESAARECQLQPSDSEVVEEALVSVGKRMSGANESTISPIMMPLALLGHIEMHRWPSLLDLASSVAGVDSPTRQYGVALVSKSRQVLLWEQEHFHLLWKFLEACKWTADQITLYRPAGLDPLLLTWAKESGFGDPIPCKPEGGTKVIQIDRAIEQRAGRAPVIHEHRVAAVRSATNKTVTSNYELIILWLTVMLATNPAAAEAPTLLGEQNAAFPAADS